VGAFSDSSSCATTPVPTTGADFQSDPLAYLTAPDTQGGCFQTNFKINSAGAPPLNPGKYCGGITVSGNGVSATLNPGLYILYGGGLTVSGGANISGTGVTFYNTTGAGFNYKPITVSGGSSTSLKAPTSVTSPSQGIPGILIFQDRSITTSSQDAISGTSSLVIEGALYFSKSKLVFSGGSTGVSSYMMIVSKLLEFSGSSTLNNDYSGLPGGSPIKVAGLVE